MSSAVIVHKHRTNTLIVDMQEDVSGSVFTSQIRSKPEITAALIVDWTVDATDAANGILTLTIDDTLSAQIVVDKGFMDIKRVVGGEPVAVFDQPLEVVFRGAVTE